MHQRLLACIVTQAFEPSQGGLFITMFKVSKSCTSRPCKGEGLQRALALRPELNCSMEAILPVRKWNYLINTDFDMQVVRCGGIPADLAERGCDSVVAPRLEN